MVGYRAVGAAKAMATIWELRRGEVKIAGRRYVAGTPGQRGRHALHGTCHSMGGHPLASAVRVAHTAADADDRKDDGALRVLARRRQT